MAGASLRTLSLSMRVLFSCFLITAGFGFLAAIYFLFLQDVDPHRKMGMSRVPSIAAKYHGVRTKTRLESALRGPMSGRVSAAEADQIIGWLRAGATQEGFAAVEPIFVVRGALSNSCPSARPRQLRAHRCDTRSGTSAPTGCRGQRRFTSEGNITGLPIRTESPETGRFRRLYWLRLAAYGPCFT